MPDVQKAIDAMEIDTCKIVVSSVMRLIRLLMTSAAL